jgi:hypothetical protein
MKLNPAAKVAATATAVIAVVYVIGVIVLNVFVSSHLTGQNDARLAERLAAVARDPAQLSQQAVPDGTGSAADDDVDGDAVPVLLWQTNAAGTVTGHSPGAPAWPAACWPRIRRATGWPSPRPWARRARSGCRRHARTAAG